MLSILSLSTLTVMAGAAVVPALGIIKAHFSEAAPILVQMIISMPALFIIITDIIFPVLCRCFGTKTLVCAGLILYTAGGCLAGVFDNIYLLLGARALVGIGVGLIMPLSTGLLSYYFSPQDRERLMGYSSAMNQLGGVIATLLSGILASAISWRASSLVYFLGFFSFILCAIFLPNERIQSGEERVPSHVFKDNYVYILSMFLLMVIFLFILWILLWKSRRRVLYLQAL